MSKEIVNLTFDIPEVQDVSLEARFKDQTHIVGNLYCFLDEASNKCNFFLTRLLGKLIETGHMEQNEARIKWNIEAMNKWLAMADKFASVLFALMHLTAGNPARSTEEVTYQYRNYVENMRNVFIMNQRFVMIPKYNKDSNLTNREK